MSNEVRTGQDWYDDLSGTTVTVIKDSGDGYTVRFHTTGYEEFFSRKDFFERFTAPGAPLGDPNR